MIRHRGGGGGGGGAEATARAEVLSPVFQVAEPILDIQFTMEYFGANEKSARSLTLKDDSLFQSVTLCKLDHEKMTFFADDSIQGTIPQNKPCTIRMVVDWEQQLGAVYIDGQELYTGPISWNKTMNTQKLQLFFRHYLTSKSALEASWKICDLRLSEEKEAAVSLNMENGGIYRAVDYAAFQLTYSGPIKDVMLQRDNYRLYQNEEPVEFVFRAESGVITVQPEGGFQENSTYRLEMDTASDIFGKDLGIPRSIEVTMISDSYTMPEVNLTPLSETVLKEGQELCLQVISRGEISYVEMVSNGAVVESFLSDQFVFTMTPEAGSYEIYARCVDRQGVMGQSEAIHVEVEENAPPEVAFLIQGEQVSFDVADEKRLQLQAFDDDGIDRIEIFVAQELYAVLTDQYEVDLDRCGIGSFPVEAVAYDRYGKFTRTQITVKISTTLYTQVINDPDFNQVEINLQRGFIEKTVVDENCGISLLMGMREVDPNFTESQYSYAQYPITGYSRIQAEFDLNIIESPQRGAKYCVNVGLRNPSSTVVMLNLADVIIASGEQFAYENNRWYHITIDADIAGGSYSVWIDGEVLVQNAQASFGEPTMLRLYTPVLDDTPCSMALDNMVISTVASGPDIIGVGYDSYINPDKISYQATAIKVYLSGTVMESDINLENVKLQLGDKTVPLAQVTYDKTANCITLQLAQMLQPSSTYTVTLSENIRIQTGIEIGGPLRVNFETGAKQIEVSGVEWSIDRQGLKASVQIVNTSQEECSVYLVATMWDDAVFSTIAAKGEILQPGEQRVCTLELQQIAGKEAELYVLTSLSKPESFVPQVYQYH